MHIDWIWAEFSATAAFHVKTLCYNPCFLFFIAEHREILHKAIPVMHPGDLQSEIKQGEGHWLLNTNPRATAFTWPANNSQTRHDGEKQTGHFIMMFMRCECSYSSINIAFMCWIECFEVKGNQFLFSFNPFYFLNVMQEDIQKNIGWDFKHLEWSHILPVTLIEHMFTFAWSSIMFAKY